jgi:hypothetical protein
MRPRISLHMTLAASPCGCFLVNFVGRLGQAFRRFLGQKRAERVSRPTGFRTEPLGLDNETRDVSGCSRRRHRPLSGSVTLPCRAIFWLGRVSPSARCSLEAWVGGFGWGIDPLASKPRGGSESRSWSTSCGFRSTAYLTPLSPPDEAVQGVSLERLPEKACLSMDCPAPHKA